MYCVVNLFIFYARQNFHLIALPRYLLPEYIQALCVISLINSFMLFERLFKDALLYSHAACRSFNFKLYRFYFPLFAELMVEFIITHMMRSFPFDLYK